MEYFVIDVGGSSIKYAVMDENQSFIRKGRAESRHLQNSDEFIACLSDLYNENGACKGGIAVSFCGEVDAEKGTLHSGGSYRYMAGLNLKKLLEEKNGTIVSVENDGNCAGLAECRYGALRGYTSAAAVVIGTGLGGALILNNALYRGIHGYTVLTCDSRNNAETEKGFYSTLKEAGAKGVISVSGLSQVTEETIPADLPLVWVDRVPQSEREIPWVANDDEAAMKEAAKYLIEKGCRNILLMPGYVAENQNNPRLEGYKKALAEAGIEFNPDYVLNRTGKGSSEQETGELIMKVMKEDTKADGIITSSDRAAFGAMKALGKVGFYSPEDVRLISFDNSPYSTMASPTITSLDRNPASLAGRACEILLDLIAGKEVQKENIISVSLVERDSTR